MNKIYLDGKREISWDDNVITVTVNGYPNLFLEFGKPVYTTRLYGARHKVPYRKYILKSLSHSDSPFKVDLEGKAFYDEAWLTVSEEDSSVLHTVDILHAFCTAEDCIKTLLLRAQDDLREAQEEIENLNQALKDL